MTANCAATAVNALVTRHLAFNPHPLTKLPGEPYVYSKGSKREIAALYHEHLVEGAWRKGKSLRKQQQIEESIRYDHLRLHKIKAHVKTEVLLNKPKKARLIQAFVRPVDNYLVADMYKAYSAAFKEWSDIPREYFGMKVHLISACGMNPVEMGQIATAIANVRGARFVLDDVKNMDASVQDVHLDEQYDLYHLCDPLMESHARSTRNGWGSIQAGKTATVYYRVYATVKSGAQDTSSGQTTRRMDGIVRTFRAIGCLECTGLIFGDDVFIAVVFQVWPSLEVLFEAQASYGWETKTVIVDDICRVDFLASTFVPDVEGGYAMIPKPGRLLAKLFWTTKKVVQVNRASYIQQVAEAFIPRFAGFHFMTTWLNWHCRVPLRRTFKGLCIDHKIVPQHHCTLQWEMFVTRRYGLLMPTEEDIQEIRECKYPGAFILSGRWARSVVAFDLADPADRDPVTLNFDS